MKTRILSLQLPCSTGGQGERRENTGWGAREMQAHFLALLFTLSMTLSKVPIFLETQLLIHKMGIINVLYHKGCGD